MKDTGNSKKNIQNQTVNMNLVIFAIIFIVALVLLALLYYLGVFLKVKVEVKRPPFAECTFLYKFHQGPYNTSGKAFDEVSKLGKKFCCAGIYFDDPEVVRDILIVNIE